MPRPYVVKPIDQGSSVGVHIVRDGDNLAAVEAAEAEFGEKVLVEKFVPGRELTVAVMGDKAVAVTELRRARVLRLPGQVHRRRHRASDPRRRFRPRSTTRPGSGR
jgi:D-alanine-D-alanine ligase-like ATP-grasp enzyme